jgi:spermidine/putrescine transport system substrate-binding protein
MESRRPMSLLRLGVAACVIGLVSACSSAGTPTTAPTAAAAATTAPTAAPTVAPTDIPADQVTGSLQVTDWTGYDAEWAWQDFKNTYANATVNFDFADTDADQFSKAKAGGQDIIHPYSGWLQLYVDEGLVAEIDTSKLKNWDKVPDSFKKLGQINGKQYFLPWDWGFTSILYRTDKITTPVDSWSILFDSKYKGHLSMWDDGPGAVTVSAYVHGYDETAITADQLAAIKAEWIAQAPLNKAYWTAETDLDQLMSSGEVWAAYAWQGAYATLLGQKVPVAYASPKEGRNSWVGFYGIKADSKNYDLALRFLDAKLGLLTGQNLVANYYYGSSNQDVMSGITDPTLKQAFSIDDPNILQHTNFTPNLTAQQRDDWTAMWTEVKASQ